MADRRPHGRLEGLGEALRDGIPARATEGWTGATAIPFGGSFAVNILPKGAHQMEVVGLPSQFSCDGADGGDRTRTGKPEGF